MKYPTKLLRRLVVTPLSVVILTFGLVSLSACDLFGSSDAGEARVRVLLIDNPFPFDLVLEANAYISRVELVGEDGPPYVVMDDERKYNLLELRNGVSALLGEVDLPAGTYSQARLIVDSASVEMKDGRTFALKVPSGSETGIKVLLQGLEIEAGQDVTLTLDFDVDQSFVALGNVATAADIQGFIFTPVIFPASISIDGDVAFDATDPEGESETENSDG